jgi:hypothetical protein
MAPWAAQLVAAGARLTHDGPDHKQLMLPDARIDIRVDEQCASVLPQALLWGGADRQWLRAQCERLNLGCRVHDDGTLELDLQSALGMNWLFVPDDAMAGTA